MIDFEKDLPKRLEFIRNTLKNAHANAIVFGNSGGKDSALVGILCKKACEDTVGVIMPCFSKRNYGIDKTDGENLADKFGIKTIVVDLTSTRAELINAIGGELNSTALNNIAPRLRMTTLYAIAAERHALVAGTGNACERYMGYFTKWGDGACDFNPIADLTVREAYAYLEYLGAPQEICTKAPSAGLFEGQTDESEMGVTYDEVEKVMRGEAVSEHSKAIIDRYHTVSEHKRQPIATFKG